MHTPHMEKTMPLFSTTTPGASSASGTPASSSRRDPAPSPQTSQFNRLLDLVTEHESRTRDQDVKIAELSRKLAAMEEERSGSRETAASPLRSNHGDADALAQEVSQLRTAVQTMSKTVSLLNSEAEAARARQREFADEVQRRVQEGQREIDACVAEVNRLRDSSAATYKHLKHQCKSYILENIGARRAELEALVAGEVARVEGKIQASADLMSRRHEEGVAALEERLRSAAAERTELRREVEGAARDRESAMASAAADLDRRLGELSSKVEEARGQARAMAQEAESAAARARQDIAETQRHLGDRTRDLKQVLKRVTGLLHRQGEDEAAAMASASALASQKLYDSWRSTIFTYSNRAHQVQAGKENDEAKFADFDSFARKLRHRLRESERELRGSATEARRSKFGEPVENVVAGKGT